MTELSENLLRGWPGRFRFGELVVRLIDVPGGSSDRVAAAMLDGIIAGQTEQEVLTELIDGGHFAAATELLDRCPALSESDIRRARGRLAQSRARYLQMCTEQRQQLAELAEQAGLDMTLDGAALAKRFELSWPAAERQLGEVRADLCERIDSRAKKLRDQLATAELPPSGTALFDSLLREYRLRAADDLLRHGSPGTSGPETVPRLPPWAWADTAPDDVLQWHLSPNSPRAPDFPQWEPADDTARQLLHAWDGLRSGGESAARNFTVALDTFLGPAPERAEVYPVAGGFLGKLQNVFHDEQAIRFRPPGGVDLFIGDPTATAPRGFPGVRQFVAAGPAIDRHDGQPRGDCAVLTLRDLLRLVAVESRRSVSVLRILGRQWPLSAFGCGSPAALAQRLGPLGTQRLPSLCWLADLTGIGGSAAAAALLFQGDDDRVLHVFLDFLTGTTTNDHRRWQKLNRWRDDKQLAASVEAAVLHPIASSPAALAAFWAALGTTAPGTVVTLREMALTAALYGLEWDHELRDGLAELSQHWMVARASPEEITLRQCGTLIGLGDLAESRLTGLAGRIADLMAATAAESAPTAWEAYRYALSPEWPAYQALRDQTPDAESLGAARRRLIDSPDELLSQTADITGRCDLVAVTDELQVAFTERFPDITLTVETPPAVRVGITNQAAYVLLYEVLSNAADALPNGGTVAAVVDIAGPDAVIDVQDTGPGLAAEVDGHRAFRKGVTTRGPGRGLGLWIARRLVTQQVDGDIQLIAASHGHPVRHGAHFRLVLPLLVEHDGPVGPDDHPGQESGH